MTLDAEALLLPALIAFYAKDCLLLLHANEGVLESRSAHGWRVSFGSQSYTLSGRQPYLLRLFTPHRPAYRMSWAMAEDADSGLAWRDDVPGALLRVVPWTFAIGLALFGLVPLALHSHVSMALLLASVGLVYALIVAALVGVWRRREPLGLSSRSWATLAAEVLLCPPYAVNLLRRLSIHASPSADLLATARARLDPRARAEVLRECAMRIQLQLEVEDEDTPRSAALEKARRSLVLRAEAEDPS